MTVNLVTMRKMVRDRLGVPPNDQFITDDVIDSSVNLAIVTFDSEHRWPWNETSTQLSFAAGEQTTTLPEDWRATRAITINHDVLEYATPYDMDRYLDGSSGQPRFYSVTNRELRVAPTPAQATTMTMYYYREPLLLKDDTSEPRCPTEHVMALIAKATQLCAIRESERFEAQDHLAEYMLAVKRARKDVDRQSTRPRGRRIRPGAWV